MEEISLKEYFQILIKRRWLIIIISILTTLSSFLVSKFLIAPTYSATSTLIVGNTDVKDSSKDNNYNDLLYYDMLVATYSRVLQSNTVLSDVVYKLPFKTTIEDVEKNLTITTKQGILLIDITIKDKNAERAMKISNQISNSFIQKVTDIMKLKQNVNIVDLAGMPKEPVSPNILLNTLIGFLVGFMLGIFITFVLEYLDNTIKNPEEIKKYLNLPVIGTIPFYREAVGTTQHKTVSTLKEGKTNNEIISRLITLFEAKSPVSEAYRTLRTNIQFSSIDKEVKSILVTSSEGSEGKSTVISNLAVAMAQLGKKVLIIDCDLRKPNLHKIFRMNNNIGFINALVENLEKDKIIRDVEEVSGLKIITSGPIPPNPSEILNSTKTKAFIKELRESFDVILIDTPPVGVVTDAAILSTYVDGVILVVGYGQARVESIKEAKESLGKVNARFIGSVLNKVPITKKKYSGKYYYRYQDYYEED